MHSPHNTQGVCADKTWVRHNTALHVLPTIYPVLEEVAQLFVDVDKAYGDDYWWYEVRTQGRDGAIELLRKNWYTVVTATLDGQLVGFAGLDEPKHNDVEMIRVMTHPAHTRQGIASACIKELLKTSDRENLTVWLDVLAHDTHVIDLYAKLGFVQFDNKSGEHSGRPAIQMRRLHPSDRQLRDRLSFTLFTEASDTLLADLANTLDTPNCKAFMLGGDPHEMIPVRKQRDLLNQKLHTVVILDGQPVGWCGWGRFTPNPNQIETSTFLAEHIWGTGINTHIKHLQYNVVEQTNYDTVFSANENNIRSIAAVRKLFPVTTEQRIWEPGKNRYSTVITPHTQPVRYVPWGTHITKPLADAVQRLDVSTPYISTR